MAGKVVTAQGIEDVRTIFSFYDTDNDGLLTLTQGLLAMRLLGFNMIQFATALHGYMSKDYILMWGYTLSFITCGVVTVLILYYSNK